MNILIFGGCGFVGLNIAVSALAKGHRVTLFDRSPVPAPALAYFGQYLNRFSHMTGDITNPSDIRKAVVTGTDIVVLGAAITAGPEREASDPAGILTVNLLAQVPILEAARDAGVRRVINLSSAAAYGLAGEKADLLTEDAAVEPAGLYAITKWASERVGTRISGHWGLDFVSVRLSGVFGPWEHVTSVRDTPSPQFQVLETLAAARPALLPRAGTRDWIYAVDVAEAVLAVAAANALPRKVYNVTTASISSVLDWGQALVPEFGGGVCRLARPGETPTINLYGPGDRAPMSGAALAEDLGWKARFDMAGAVAHLCAWRRDNGDIASASAPTPGTQS